MGHCCIETKVRSTASTDKSKAPVCRVPLHFGMVAPRPFQGQRYTRAPPDGHNNQPPHPGTVTAPQETESLDSIMDAQEPSSATSRKALPAWDGTPIKASLFLRDIGDHAAEHGYLSLLLNSYFISRQQIITASSDVVPMVRQHFSDPVAFPLADDIQNPPDPPLPATRDTTYVLTAEDRRLYVASPEILLAESSRWCQVILSAISNPARRHATRTPSCTSQCSLCADSHCEDSR